MAPSAIYKLTVPTLTFPDAMQSVIDGKRITKQEWDNPGHYAELRNGLLMIYLDTGWHKWIVSDGDMMGTDWVELVYLQG